MKLICIKKTPWIDDAGNVLIEGEPKYHEIVTVNQTMNYDGIVCHVLRGYEKNNRGQLQLYNGKHFRVPSHSEVSKSIRILLLKSWSLYKKLGRMWPLV